jgi:hypothetical protein
VTSFSAMSGAGLGGALGGLKMPFMSKAKEGASEQQDAQRGAAEPAGGLCKWRTTWDMTYLVVAEQHLHHDLCMTVRGHPSST